VFADAKENDEMIAKLLESGWVDIIYEDDEARILKIRDVKGDPPKDAGEEEPETEEEKKQLDAEENELNTDPNLNVNLDDTEN
jgi:TFIIF-interacting CTD phosphatase-like protein